MLAGVAIVLNVASGATPGASKAESCWYNADCCGSCTGFFGSCVQNQQHRHKCDTKGHGDCGDGLICKGDYQGWNPFANCNGRCEWAVEKKAVKVYANTSCEREQQGADLGNFASADDCAVKCKATSGCHYFMFAPGQDLWNCFVCRHPNNPGHPIWHVYQPIEHEKHGLVYGRRMPLEEEKSIEEARLAFIVDGPEAVNDVTEEK